MTAAEQTGLTPRQLEVVKLVAEDLCAKEIAERLGISRKTIEFHKEALKRKLGVRGTAGITRYAIRNGLIEA
jgi:DNA-binding CsgD family transcriptional regulator